MAAQLMAGAGGAHITPPIGFPMGGYGARHQGAQGVHDQLNTHTLFLDDGTGSVPELIHIASGFPNNLVTITMQPRAGIGWSSSDERGPRIPML